MASPALSVPKFVQLAVAPASDSHNLEILALDESGAAWTYDGEKSGWRPLNMARQAAPHRVSEGSTR